MHTTALSSQDEFDSWSKLTTVTSFDEGATQPMDELEGNGVLLQDVKSFSSLSLLVESLIEQLCKLLEKDEERQKTLYHAICHKLHQMKLIDQTYGIEEFQFMRSHYQKALYRLMSVAKSTAIESNSNANSTLLHLSGSLDINATVFQQQRLLDLSRYRTEYEELEYIAKGGFGRVHKVRNKLDGGVYAIKKICLRYHNVSCFLRNLREVKMLAQLNHPNIVSYKAAWLEPFAPPNASDVGGTVDEEELSSFLAARSTDSRQVVIDSVSKEDSWGIVFKESQSTDTSTRGNVTNMFDDEEESSVMDLREIFNEPGPSVTVHSVRRTRKTMLVDDSETSDETSVSSLEDRALCEYRGWSTNHVTRNVWKFDNAVSLQQREWATLYIQMQLCETTLRQWLDQRNSQARCIVNLEQSISTFYQIVRGIEYIHSKNIVHHDIKPSNIFVNSDLSQTQVGDFGLACCLQHSTPGLETYIMDDSGSTHKGEVGTKLYAAPEQLNGKCDPKSDIYSLGVVLFELVQSFSTDMERSKVIGQLKTGNVSLKVGALSSKLVDLINQLLSPLPANRPTARQLLVILDELLNHRSLTTGSKDETIKHLQDIIEQKDKEIEELKQRLQLYERTTKES